MKKAMSLMLLGAIVIMATGCTGPFALTKKVHKWQTSFDSKWADEGMFLVCAILPDYVFSSLGDAVIFNSLDFWGEENPVASTDTLRGNELCLISVAEQM